MYKCRKCGKIYVPYIHGFPAPNECDCGSKEFVTVGGKDDGNTKRP